MLFSTCRLDDPVWVFSYSFAAELFHSLFLAYLIFDVGFNLYYADSHWDSGDMLHHACFGILVVVHILYWCSLYKNQFLWLTIGELIVPFQQLRCAPSVAHKSLMKNQRQRNSLSAPCNTYHLCVFAIFANTARCVQLILSQRSDAAEECC